MPSFAWAWGAGVAVSRKIGDTATPQPYDAIDYESIIQNHDLLVVAGRKHLRR